MNDKIAEQSEHRQEESAVFAVDDDAKSTDEFKDADCENNVFGVGFDLLRRNTGWHIDSELFGGVVRERLVPGSEELGSGAVGFFDLLDSCSEENNSNQNSSDERAARHDLINVINVIYPKIIK